MLFFYNQISAWMGISEPIFLLVIGITLLGFAVLVYKTATATIISEKMVKFIIVQGLVMGGRKCFNYCFSSLWY